MLAKIFITLKDGVLDPQGAAISNSLNHMGFNSVDAVNQGKLIKLEFNHNDQQKAQEEVKIMCEKLLVNTVIENYDFEIIE